MVNFLIQCFGAFSSHGPTHDLDISGKQSFDIFCAAIVGFCYDCAAGRYERKAMNL
jgi:hypothetical protein